MTPAARVQAAIEVLDLIIAAARQQGAPADRLIAEWFRTRRFAGSGDRRAVRDLVYRAIRTCGEIPSSGRAAMLLLAQADPDLAALFDGTRHAPEPGQEGEPVAQAGVAPQWLEAALEQSGIAADEAAALLDRAPFDLRVNTLKIARDGIELPVPFSPTCAAAGIRLAGAVAADDWDAVRLGLVEVQDTGSQLACQAASAMPGESVIDLCAGAGGKTLALAAAMENRGALLACDTDRGRLSRLMPRAARAGVAIAETLLLDPQREAEALAGWMGRADAVLVDAPCSGTGTWRRNPEARWRLTPDVLARNVQLQARLLDLAAGLLRPGGRLVFVTCSLLDAEGRDQADRFLRDHPGWQARALDLPAGRSHGPGIRLTPLHDQTDGFFIAGFDSPC